MVETSAKHFIDLVMSQTQEIKNLRVDEHVAQVGYHTGGTTLLISNSIFTNLVFPYINYHTINITDCKIDYLVFDQGRTQMLRIEKCEVEMIVVESNYKNDGAIQIINSTVDTLIIRSGGLQQFEIENSRIEKIVLTDRLTRMDIKDLQGTITKIKGSRDSQICYCNSITSDGTVEQFNITKSHILNMGVNGLASHIEFDSSVIADTLRFEAKPGHVVIYSSDIHNFESLVGLNHSYIYGSKIGIFTLRSSMSNFELDRGKLAPHVDTTFGTLDICDTRYSGFTLYRCQVETLLMNNFSCAKADMLFVVVTKEVTFEYSNMEEAKMHNMNLSDGNLKFLNSSMAKSKIINVEWPAQFYEYKTESMGKSVRDKLNILWPLKEAYRQIKVLSLDQQNQVDALAFQKHELKIYWKIVRTRLSSKEFFRWRDIGNWMLLGTNRIFSDFGQSWILPLSWLLATHSLFFYLLFDNFELGLKLDFQNAQYQATEKGIAMFVNLLNPIHSTDIKYPWDNTTKISIFGTTDFFMRLFAGYFIYYFLKATRKFAVSSFN